jgi:hypothetical protein
MVPGDEDDPLDRVRHPLRLALLAARNRKEKPDMLQIDPIVFLMQVAGLFAWIGLAALVYSVIEKALGGPWAPEDPTKM